MTESELEHIIWADVDKPDRIRALWLLRHEFSPLRFWKLFRDVWTNSESLYQHVHKFPELFSLHPDYRDAIMNLSERQAVAKFDYPLHIYRGGWVENIWGWSWTLDRDRAVWFANRCPMDGKPLLAEGWIPRRDVIGYLADRNEQEIIVDPDKVQYRNGVVNPLPGYKPSETEMFFQLVQSGGFRERIGLPEEIKFLVAQQPKMIMWRKERAVRLRKAGLDWLADQDDEWVRIAEE